MLSPLKIPPKFSWILRRIYGLPATITVITGWWKTGKTDYALKIAETCLGLGLIDKIASNIETPDPRVKYVKSLSMLKYWFFNEKGKKIYIYDEVIESTPRRRAMSTINVEWVKTIPQLSKARGHIIAVTQEQTLTESTFLNPTFCRGIWKKLGLKTVALRSPLLRGEEYILQGIPPTTIKFDPYLPATFQLEERSMLTDALPFPLKAMSLYAEGNSFSQIRDKLELKQSTQVRRLIQRGCRIFVTMLQQPSEGKDLIETCNKLDKENVDLPNTTIMGKAKKV